MSRRHTWLLTNTASTFTSKFTLKKTLNTEGNANSKLTILKWINSVNNKKKKKKKNDKEKKLLQTKSFHNYDYW